VTPAHATTPGGDATSGRGTSPGVVLPGSGPAAPSAPLDAGSFDASPLDELLAARAAALGGGRLVCVDGPAGSGKTTLASLLEGRWGATVVHMDDLYAGWEGRDLGVRQLLDGVLAPLSRARPGRYERYDWYAGRFAGTHVVEPCPVLVVEGCGSATREVDRYDALVVWVEAPDDVRLRRGLERDGAGMRDHWLQWMADEKDFYARERTRDRAQAHIDGTRGAVAPRHNEEDA